MANQANLVLSVNAVSTTYIPLTPYFGKDHPAVWLKKDPATPLGNRRIEISMSRNSNGTRKNGFKVIIPNALVVNGVPTLVSKAIFDSNNGYSIPANATQAQIDELFYTVAALSGHAVMKSFVADEEPAT